MDFPNNRNREIYFRNREIFGTNREREVIVGKPNTNSKLPLASIKSVSSKQSLVCATHKEYKVSADAPNKNPNGSKTM